MMRKSAARSFRIKFEISDGMERGKKPCLRGAIDDVAISVVPAEAGTHTL
jgi:hypothetical protein